MIDPGSLPLDQQTPDQHRSRYDALRAQAQERSANRTTRPCPPIPPESLLHRETVPGGWYWSTRVPRGQTLRIANPTGRASVSLILWNATDTSERLNVADTVKIQWTVGLGAGHLLLSDMGRVMAFITADSGARHDPLLGGSTAASNQRRYGRDHRNTRDNLLLAASKHGMDRRDIPPCLTLFADLRVDETGRFVWGGAPTADSATDLRAEMDLLVALSNCPHPLDPAPLYAPPPIEAMLWRAAPADADDLCRTSNPEARRAFENTAGLAQ